jgi:two-component system CheB/CheR fusion protein
MTGKKEKEDPATGKVSALTGPAEFPIVGIGASAGGLEAFERFFKAMVANPGMAFVLVVHLAPTHVSILPELLQKKTKMKVLQVTDNMKVQPDHVYIIPPNKELAILNGSLQLMDLVKSQGVNLPIDSFLRSLAQDQGSNAICIILSGTGTDGTLGLRTVKGEGGMAMVQDEESAQYEGMPRSAIATGLADYVLPVDKIPEQLLKYVKHASHTAAASVYGLHEKADKGLKKIFLLLRTATGHDFSLYKKNTIFRRIERRMHVH